MSITSINTDETALFVIVLCVDLGGRKGRSSGSAFIGRSGLGGGKS